MIHFLHIGKTGGSAVRNAIETSTTATPDLVLHGHTTTLKDVPEGDKVFFFLRDPITRFVSAFYSRRREGRPNTYRPWKPEETVAFTRFETARDLAEALSSADQTQKQAAEAAMRSIGHVRSSFYDWVISDEYLEARRNDILLIGFQETLSNDFERLRGLGVVPATAVLPDDDVRAHRTPAVFDRTLSLKATENLRRWYARDLALFERLSGPPSPLRSPFSRLRRIVKSFLSQVRRNIDKALQ